MKRIMWLVPAVLVLCATAQAQSVPEWEIYGGFSMLEANVNGAEFNLAGGGGSVTENVNSWFAGRLEFNAYGGTEGGTNVTAQTITYGPVFSYRRFQKLVPFGDFQLGAIHASKGYLGISEPAFKLAVAPGGGVDYELNDRVAIRAQADYLMTRFLDLRQDNLRLSAGIVVRFGSR